MYAKIVLGIWIAAGLYVGSAGWSRAELEERINLTVQAETDVGPVDCRGIVTSSLEECLAVERSRMTEALFPWVPFLPTFFGFLIMALGFGAVGGVINVLRQTVVGDKKLEELDVVSTPMFGALVGILVLGMSYLLPAALVSSGGALRPTSLLFLTLIGGAFSGHVIDWIESWLKDFFPGGPDTTEDGGKSDD